MAEVDLEKLALEVEMLKKALNWSVCDLFKKELRMTIKDEGVRAVVSTSGEYEDIIVPLTDEQYAILDRE